MHPGRLRILVASSVTIFLGSGCGRMVEPVESEPLRAGHSYPIRDRTNELIGLETDSLVRLEAAAVARLLSRARAGNYGPEMEAALAPTNNQRIFAVEDDLETAELVSIVFSARQILDRDRRH